jgi:pimeloyl-ACP methyl ester carboxylesterase
MVCDGDLSCYGLVLEENWEQVDESKPVVIVVHGYNSCPQRNKAMADAIRSAGYPTGMFSYPNDYTIVTSAQLLSSELRRFRHQHPDRRVVLVCHSMGGMVARTCLEDSLYDPENVDRLILIAPPTHGSAIAHFAVGTDVWEHWLARRNGGPWRRIRDSVIDGLGEAADELCPDSTFLADLNSRPRNPRVEYTVILGTGASMTEAEMQWIRESVIAKLAKVPGAETGAKRLETLLSDMDELVEGKGDGVVAVSRGRLDGVSDTLVLPFGHLSVTGAPESEVVQEVQQLVIERLN